MTPMEPPAHSPDPAPLVLSAPRIPPSVLFASFLRLGLTAFGGPAMVAYIRDLAVKKRQWLSQETFEDGTALCQSIPGATAMQTAAYVGLRAGGPLGALAAFVGFGLPAFLLMVLLSAAYRQTRDLATVVAAFRGLHVLVIAIIANAAFDFGRKSIRNWRDAFIAAVAALFLGLHGNPMLMIAAAALLGLILYRGLAPVTVPARAAEVSGPTAYGRFLLFFLLFLAIGLAALALLDARLVRLAALMMKVDVFAFGGGFASIPLMLHEVVDRLHWLDAPTFLDGIALGQVTPGPIVITATFVGYQVAGLPGALAGTVGIFAPSFVMGLLAVPQLDRLQHSASVRRALRGALASFIGLLVAVTVQFALAVPWSLPAVLLASATFAALRLKVDILWVVLAGALLSVFLL